MKKDRVNELVNLYTKYLQDNGRVITEPIKIEIQILSSTVAEIEKVAAIVREEGTTQKTPKSDYRQISPAFSSLIKLQDQQRAYYDKLDIRSYEVTFTKQDDILN